MKAVIVVECHVLRLPGKTSRCIIAKPMPPGIHSREEADVWRQPLTPIQGACFAIMGIDDDAPCMVAYDKHGNMLRHDHAPLQMGQVAFDQLLHELTSIMAAGWGLGTAFSCAVMEGLLATLVAAMGDQTPDDPEQFDSASVDSFLADISKSCH